MLPDRAPRDSGNAARDGNDKTAEQQAEKNFSIRANDPEMMASALPGLSMAANPNRPRALAVDQEAAIMAGLLLGSPEFQRR